MTQSKISEKATRFTDVYESERHNLISDYLKEVTNLSNESAKSHRFAALMASLFGTTNREILRDFFQGFETKVNFRDSDFIVKRGRIDNLCGNLIVEFEKDLNKTLAEAEHQLRMYSLAIAQKQGTTNPDYICLASDGIRFRIYIPQIAEVPIDKLNLDHIQLIKSDGIDLRRSALEDLYYFLDRYFFRVHHQDPTTENFAKDFGLTSPAFARMQEALTEAWDTVKSDSSAQVVKSNWEKYLTIAYGSTSYNDSLFIRHTYLASLAKLMVYFRLKSNQEVNRQEITSVLEGNYFRQVHRIINFLDQDFFSWVCKPETWKRLENYFYRLSFQLLNYNLKAINEDVLKGLYQELVDPKDRHDLGEYYTPDWLAGEIIEKLLKNNPEKKVLDPTCGSGTFLVQAIKFKRDKLPPQRQLEKITNQVFGVDIHPLAVIVAKTNYLLALGDLLARDSDLHIPVFLADSLYSPDKISTATQLALIERNSATGFPVKIDVHDAKIPEALFRKSQLYDQVLDFAGETARNFTGQKHIKSSYFHELIASHFPEIKQDKEALQLISEIIVSLKETIESNRDSIWIYILKNLYKPLFWHGQIDCIVGNPPWLSLRFLAKDKYQERMKKAVINLGLIQSNQTQLTTHLELATLFFVQSIQMYLNGGGKIAFVLPRSVFSADQHQNFRSKEQLVKYSLDEVWDLQNIEPLFNVPSCVVFGTKDKDKTYPFFAVKYSGHLSKKNTSKQEARSVLTKTQTQIYLQTIGEKQVWFEGNQEPPKMQNASSPYKQLFDQGATLVPRSFWFVEIGQPNSLGGNTSLPYVKTSKLAHEFAKEQFKEVNLSGNIEKEFIFETLLSTDIVPFGHLSPRNLVLPIKDNTNSWKMIEAHEAQIQGSFGLSEWLEKCDALWKKIRDEKKKQNIYERLDYMRGITGQNPSTKYFVLYSSSGTDIVSCMTESTGKFVADYKTYFFQASMKSEAQYLIAILNSPTSSFLIKPMQTTGLFGPRDICKKIWELPIPRYQENNADHNRLSALAASCQEKVASFLSTVNIEPSPHAIGRLRRQVRELLKEELTEIDSLVRLVMELK